MGPFGPVPEQVRPTYNRYLRYSLLRAPGQALMVGLASLIAVKSLNAPPWELALISAALPFGNLLAIFWSKSITFSPRKIRYAFWPEVAGSVICLFIALTRNAHAFTAIYCFFLLIRAPLIQTHSAIMRANYPAEVRSTLVARILAISQVLIALLGLVFGFLLESDPMVFRALFPLAGVCSLLGAFQINRIHLEGEQGAPNNGGSARPDYSLRRILSVLRYDKRFRRYEIAFFLFGFANIMTLPIVPLFLEHDLGIRYGDAGLILVTLPMLLEVLILPLWGRTLDRNNPLLMRAIFNVIFAVGMLINGLSTSLWIFATGRVIVGLVQGGSGLVWILGVNYFARRDQLPIYMGLHQTLTGIRGMLAPFVGIALAGLLHSNNAVFIAAFVMMNLGTLVMIGEVLGERRRLGGRLPTSAQVEREIDAGFSA